MKKYALLILFMIVSLVFIGVSCGSTPEPETAQPAQQTPAPAQAAESAPAADPVPQQTQTQTPPPVSSVDQTAVARAERAKNRAIDFKIDAYAGSEWDNVVARHNAARTTADYNSAADDYEKLFNDFIWMYAMQKETDITGKWERVSATGYTPFAQEYLKDAEDTALAAYDQSEAGDYETARDSAELAELKFDSLLYAAELFDTREALFDTGFVYLAPQFVNRADYIALSAIPLYDAGDYTGAWEAADNAMDEYETMLLGADVFKTRWDLVNLVYYTPLLINPEAMKYLYAADNIANAAVEQYEVGDNAQARVTAMEAKGEYELLELGARVWLVREDIIDFNFVQYDTAAFANADSMALSALDDFDAGNREEAVKKAADAQLRYNMILDNAWPIYAAEKNETAVSERQRAIAERANVAARDTFTSAEYFFSEAQRLFASGEYKNASYAFNNAQAMFLESIEETVERRRVALETIRLAEEMLERSSGTASEAGRIIEGGSR